MTASSIEKRLRKPKPKKFYHVGPDFRLDDTRMADGKYLMPPRHGRSFPALSEPLRLSPARRLGAFSRLLVCDRMKAFSKPSMEKAWRSWNVKRGL